MGSDSGPSPGGGEEKPYRWFDHTADIGMEVEGRSISELFTHAALGLYELLGAPARVAGHEIDEINLRGADLEELLVGWLSELLYRFGVEGRVYHLPSPEVRGDVLSARLEGGTLPPGAARGTREVKAVTYHEIEVKETAQGWAARVVFDV